MENREGEGKTRVGNVEAKELISMTHGHELYGGNVGERGWAGWSGVRGGEWDNCNSIINNNKKEIQCSLFFLQEGFWVLVYLYFLQSTLTYRMSGHCR